MIIFPSLAIVAVKVLNVKIKFPCKKKRNNEPNKTINNKDRNDLVKKEFVSSVE